MSAKITLSRQKQIDKTVSQMLLSLDKSYPENSLLEIAKAADLEVFVSDFKEHAETVSGIIIPAENQTESTKIYLNQNHSKTRQTFTLAHELGHYFLHDSKPKLRIDKYNYKAGSEGAKEETEANYFAATLLMPKEIFLEIINRSSSFSQVADYFAVSEIAVRNRWRWLSTN